MKEERNVSLAKLVTLDGNRVTLQVDNVTAEQLQALQHSADIELRIDDGRRISNDQRAKCFAMFRDIADWSGFSIFEVEDWMKAYYMVANDVKYFSLSDTSIENASQFIDYLITFCLQWNVPFKTKTWDKIHGSYHFQLECLLTRTCAVCGTKRNVEIDHVTPVGIGRNRRKTDNTKLYFEALCHKHHMLRHSLGINTFMSRYKLKPIKLTAKQIKELHIGGIGHE